MLFTTSGLLLTAFWLSAGAVRKFMQQTITTPTTGLYIHIPFCEKKCPYCDFNTYAGLDSLFAETVDAICLELTRWKNALASRHIRTIFLGGGTPTALPLSSIVQILETVEDTFSLAADCEITSEVNPGTVDRAKFRGLRAAGVNRLSIGVQSFQPQDLTFLGRIHSAEDAYRAYEAARTAGFDNINLDFMFGLAGQQVDDWHDTLKQAVDLAPEHLSLYSLIVEPNTPLHHWVTTGQVAVPNEDTTGTLYEKAMETLAQAGYIHYEVSNWTKRVEQSSQHNLVYWRNQEYLGVGPGAHSHLRLPKDALKLGLIDLCIEDVNTDISANDEQDISVEIEVTEDLWLRWGNRKPVPSYGQRIRQGDAVIAQQEQIDVRTAMGETMMLGLRLVQEGVPFEHFQALHQEDVRAVFETELAQLQAWDLIELVDQRVRLTPKGLMVGNQVFMHFLPSN